MKTNSILDIHQTFPGYQPMPLIGMTSDSSYAEAVLNAGGIPLVLPAVHQTDVLANLLNSLDGILLTNGQEPLLIQLATDRQIPMLSQGKRIRTYRNWYVKQLHSRKPKACTAAS